MITEKIEKARIKKALRDTPTSPLSPRECIIKALDNHPGKTVVSWSGGRCSTAVLYMTRDLNPEIPVVFNDTGVEFPETYDLIDEVRDQWKVNLKVVKPQTTFWKIVEDYGFPMLRGKYYKRKKISKDGKPMCCLLLKENPLRKFFKENSYEATLTGLRACESRMRMFGIGQFGQYYYAKTYKHWRYHPIAFWTTKDLEAFISKNDIPQNKVYSMGHERCGCWPCTGYITWQESLRKSHPKLYRFLAKKSGSPTLWEYMGGNCVNFLRSEGLV